MEKFFHPLKTIDLKPFRKHYAHADVIGQEASDEQCRILDDLIFHNVYGGLPLTRLYEGIEIAESETGPLTVDITLFPARNSPFKECLVLNGVSLRQFLVAGLPKAEWYDQRDWIDERGLWRGDKGCGDKCYWSEMADAQYRLEICHAEISRWSIFFKRDGETLGGADIDNGDDLTRIELVNNCTTTAGFEFRVTYCGQTYHGSFGSRTGPLHDVYKRLSACQAGSIAKQQHDLTENAGDANIPFGWGGGIYGACKSWGPGKENNLTRERTIRIDLDRYRPPQTSVDERQIEGYSLQNIDLGAIDYGRFGVCSEYYQKAQVRRLMHGRGSASAEDHRSKTPPDRYQDIKDAETIKVANFDPTGIYDFTADELQEIRGHKWLYQLDKCFLRSLRQNDVGTALYDLEFQRSCCKGEFQLRRLVFGNLDLRAIWNSVEPWTLHRFGYGARPTIMDYDAGFEPPTNPNHPAHYAYLLAGTHAVSKGTGRADYYVMPEPFGLERAIFSRDRATNDLVIDLISFERILFLWRARVPLGEGW